jgi:hypothetical protein
MGANTIQNPSQFLLCSLLHFKIELLTDSMLVEERGEAHPGLSMN